MFWDQNWSTQTHIQAKCWSDLNNVYNIINVLLLMFTPPLPPPPPSPPGPQAVSVAETFAHKWVTVWESVHVWRLVWVREWVIFSLAIAGMIDSRTNSPFNTLAGLTGTCVRTSTQQWAAALLKQQRLRPRGRLSMTKTLKLKTDRCC